MKNSNVRAKRRKILLSKARGAYYFEGLFEIHDNEEKNNKNSNNNNLIIGTGCLLLSTFVNQRKRSTRMDA